MTTTRNGAATGAAVLIMAQDFGAASGSAPILGLICSAVSNGASKVQSLGGLSQSIWRRRIEHDLDEDILEDALVLTLLGDREKQRQEREQARSSSGLQLAP